MKLSLPSEIESVVSSSPAVVAASPCNVLLASSSEQPHIVAHRFLAHAGFAIHSCFSYADALDYLQIGNIAAIIFDRDTRDGSWTDLLQASHAMENPARLILFARHVDVALWAEVLNLGGYDLLMYPFKPEEIICATTLACEAWAREGSGRFQDMAKASAYRRVQDRGNSLFADVRAKTATKERKQ